MNLNLGLESLNGSARGAVVPFTPASAIEMQNASEAITNLMSSLENYYDAARNAMLVKKAVKKYGKTQSIVALIGQEGLAAAQSFSMEGFWEKVKNFLIKIWEKIKEWWGRFWGMFFSVENKLSSFESTVKGGKRLAHTVEFEATSESDMDETAKKVREAVQTIKTVLNDPTDASMQQKISMLVVSDNGGGPENGSLTSGKMGFRNQVYKLEIGGVQKLATKLLAIIKEFKQLKKDIDEYVKKALDKIKTMKIKDAGSAGDAFGIGQRNASDKDRNASVSEQDTATKVLKNAAKVNNQMVASVIKAATNIAIKLMAHTRLSD